jgi:hypothetical protein
MFTGYLYACLWLTCELSKKIKSICAYSGLNFLKIKPLNIIGWIKASLMPLSPTKNVNFTSDLILVKCDGLTFQASHGRNFEAVARTSFRNKESQYTSLSLPFSFAVASIFFFVLLIECFSLNVFAYHKKIWYLCHNIFYTTCAGWILKQSLVRHTAWGFSSCRQVDANSFYFLVCCLSCCF